MAHQDIQLGGWDPMVQTKKLLQDDPNGAFLTNWRIHTPICSPRGASIKDIHRVVRFFNRIRQCQSTNLEYLFISPVISNCTRHMEAL